MKLILIAFAFLVSCLMVNAQEYVVTASSCENTADMTTVCSAVIDSNWLDHKEVHLFMNIQNYQYSGTAQYLKTTLWIQGIPYVLFNGVVSNNAGTGEHWVEGRIYREGSLLYIGKGSLGFNGAPTATNDFAGVSGSGSKISGVDFNSPISIQFTVQWSTSTNVFYKVLSGRLTQK